MSGQVKFSSMLVATSVAATDRIPLLSPSSTNQNKTVPIHTLFDGISVDIRTNAKMIHNQPPDIVSVSTTHTAASRYCIIDVNGPTASVNLIDGEEGQELIFFSRNLISDCYVYPVSRNGFNSIRFSAVGSTCHLIFLDGKWNVLASFNVTIS